ncbi:glycosyltransferase family 4 protein [Micrococcaceae bacterium Sec5.7]
MCHEFSPGAASELTPSIVASVKKSPLKITILGLHYAPEPSGNAPYTTSLAEGLAARGHTVRVLTGYPHYPEWQLHTGYRGWSADEVINGIPVARLRHHIPRRPTGLTRLHMELSFGCRLVFARWGSPDVVLLVSPALFSSGLALARARFGLRRPAVGVWVQDLYSRGIVETGGQAGLLSRLAAQLEGKILGLATGVVAIHERFARYIVDELGVSADSVRVVRNWTHLPDIPVGDRSETRQRLGWGQDEIIVLHSGNMGKKQGLTNVVEAAKSAHATGSPTRFVLMGDGNQRPALMQAGRGVANLSFVDSLPQDEFQAALQAADVLLVNELPGVRDMSVPSKLTSYYSTGIPVIAATDEGSVTAEELKKSCGGLRVNAGDPIALVKAAEALSRNRRQAAELGANGLRFRHETLSESTAIALYDNFITSLASSRDH